MPIRELLATFRDAGILVVCLYVLISDGLNVWRQRR